RRGRLWCRRRLRRRNRLRRGLALVMWSRRRCGLHVFVGGREGGMRPGRNDHDALHLAESREEWIEPSRRDERVELPGLRGLTAARDDGGHWPFAHYPSLGIAAREAI